MDVKTLNELKINKLKEIGARTAGEYTEDRTVLVCGGTGCTSGNSRKILDAFHAAVEREKLNVKVVMTGCFGLCALGPIVIVYPEGAFYSQVKVEDVDKIVNLHLKEGTVVRELLYEETLGEDGSVKPLSGTAFYKKQNRVALRNCGRINPECIEEYIAFDGYQALRKVLFEMTPDDVVNTIKASGLRGRGGGGFPTGMKWDFTKRAVGDKKFVACNADEGDPGAFMDRSVLEGDPHCLIEAMAIAAYAVGSDPVSYTHLTLPTILRV